MNKKDIQTLSIRNNDLVKVVQTKRNVDIRFTENSPINSESESGIPQSEREAVKRLTKDTFLDPVTKTEKRYQHKDQRTANESTFYRTRRELNWLILNSFEGKGQEMMLTLTYKGGMKDYTQLNKDFRNFSRRLANSLKNKGPFEYIVVREPHLSGDWHMHVLLKFIEVTSDARSLPSTLIEWRNLVSEKWRLGIVDVQPIDNVNHLASYLSNHLTNISVDQNGEEIESFTQSLSAKSIAKNRRLQLYPMNFKIYTYSSGFQKPPKIFMRFEDCVKLFEETHFKNWDNSFLLYNDNFALTQRHIQLTLKE